MNRLPTETRVQILQMLCEGSSMRAISRVTGVSINTVTKLLVDAGTVASAFHDAHVRQVTSTKRVQCDEIWSFCFAKKKNAKPEMKAAGTAGDVWTWTSWDPDSKLMVTWQVGDRTAECAELFMRDLAVRVANRVQITTDGFGAYPNAVMAEFRGKADFAQLQKIYGDELPTTPERRYSPAVCIGARKYPVHGNPAPEHISTSHVERSNLTLRMGMKRFARLINAQSKKVENHGHALALYFAFYNWIRPHASLKGRTPAMAAGLADVALTWEEFVMLMDRAEFEIGRKSS